MIGKAYSSGVKSHGLVCASPHHKTDRNVNINVWQVAPMSGDLSTIRGAVDGKNLIDETLTILGTNAKAGA